VRLPWERIFPTPTSIRSAASSRRRETLLGTVGGTPHLSTCASLVLKAISVSIALYDPGTAPRISLKRPIPSCLPSSRSSIALAVAAHDLNAESISRQSRKSSREIRYGVMLLRNALIRFLTASSIHPLKR